jgi:hypothetical protein
MHGYGPFPAVPETPVTGVGRRICNFSIITIEMAGRGPYNTHE